MSDKPCHVYVISRIKQGRFIGPVKVGISDNPRARLTQIGTASPFKVGLIHSLMVPLRAMAQEMEAAFHATQAEHRLNGEWFDMSPSKALLILVLQFDWHMQFHGVPEDVAEPARELSGAGSRASLILKMLRTQETDANG